MVPPIIVRRHMFVGGASRAPQQYLHSACCAVIGGIHRSTPRQRSIALATLSSAEHRSSPRQCLHGAATLSSAEQIRLCSNFVQCLRRCHWRIHSRRRGNIHTALVTLSSVEFCSMPRQCFYSACNAFAGALFMWRLQRCPSDRRHSKKM